jgi:hypothetical protein
VNWPNNRFFSDLFLIATSLMIAFVIWMIAKRSDLGQQSLDVPVRLKNVPEYVKAEITPSDARITVSLPNSYKGQIQPNQFFVEVNWEKDLGDERRWCGRTEFRTSPQINLSPSHIQVSPSLGGDLKRLVQKQGIHFISIEPEKAFVKAKFISRKADITFPVKRTLPEGFKLAGPIYSKSGRDILLTAPEKVFAEMGGAATESTVKVNAEAIDLTDRRSAFTTTVRLEIPDKIELIDVEDQRIEVQVPITEIGALQLIENVPIKIQTKTPNLTTDYNPKKASVSVRGPRASLGQLKASDLVIQTAAPVQESDGLVTTITLKASFVRTASPDLVKSISLESVSPESIVVKYKPRPPDSIWNEF